MNALVRRPTSMPAMARRLGRRLGQDRIARPGEVNHAFMDRFTLAHYAWGVILGASRAPWWLVPIVAIGWEVVERPLKRQFPRAFPHATQDTWPNMIGDAGAMISGYLTWRALQAAATKE